MLSNVALILLTLLYLALLFWVANMAEKRSKNNSSFLNNPYTYALSLAVYCTAWTFFGSVGNAAQNGLEFLTIYLGPTIAAPLFVVLLRKIIRISKAQKISSIADFISARYGKHTGIGILVTLICLFGIIPYIALQLKAIMFSFALLGDIPKVGFTNFYSDIAFYLALILALFTIIYGIRHVEATENRVGMVTAIAFESIIKLVAFLVVGFYVVYVMFNGFSDIFTQAETNSIADIYNLSNANEKSDWFWMIFLSFFAIFLLPRQFQVAVVENVNEKHLLHAVWVFPLFLLLINLFVVPIALAGNLTFVNSSVAPDAYVISLPIVANNMWIAIIAYIGGFSAAASMIVISTIAISIMVSNNLMMPLVVGSTRMNNFFNGKMSLFLMQTRRTAVFLIILMAYGYNLLIKESYSLLSVGLISFAAVAQFAPAIIGGLYWKSANIKGAFTGMLAGFLVWGYTLALPSVSEKMTQENLGFLNPQNLFNLDLFAPLGNGVFWSLFVNTTLFISISVFSKQGSTERNQAEIFVDIFKYAKSYESSIAWKGKAYLQNLTNLLKNLLGERRTEKLQLEFTQQYNTNWEGLEADSRMVNYVERQLAGAIGSASARIMVSSVTSEEEISITEVLDILKESQQLMSTNQELVKKSEELKRAYQQIAVNNHKLKESDKQKDEFLSLVTHELRTPITSIKALSEILLDTEDITDEEKNQFLKTIIKESDRLSRLISQVLDLEKLESGNQKLTIGELKIKEIIDDASSAVASIIQNKKITLNVSVSPNLPTMYGDKDRITQVIINLLSNAAKYAKAQNGVITVAAYHLDNALKVSVQDNGEGIDAQVETLIFDKFFQAKNNNKKVPGSGLGLAICKQIVNLHEGKIWVESSPGNGAKFCFTIPSKRF
ncbi:MAG: sodium:solute symporter family transporter [Luteibaculaceae bacterium]